MKGDYMMKLFLVSALVLVSQQGFAKTLTVDCSGDGKSVKLVSEIANVNSQPKLKSLEVNGEKPRQSREASTTPVYNKETKTFKLRVNFGQSLFSSVVVTAQDCDDSFTSGGTATLREHVGGFAGSDET